MKINILFFKILFLVFVNSIAVKVLSQTVTIGNLTGPGNGVTNKLPVVPNYNYSYSQQIIPKTEINTAGNITKIRFYSLGNALDNSSEWTIYLGQTTKTSFANSTDWILPPAMIKVFSGNVSAPTSAQWMEITLQVPFAYNNLENLVIAVDENENGYTPGTFTNYFRAFNASGTNNSAIYYQSDGTNPDPTNINLTGVRVNYRSNIQLVFNSASYCLPSSNGSNNNYIDEVKFLGTLNDVSKTSGNSSTSPGYSDWTGEPKSQQIQGGGVNVFVSTKDAAFYKAWIDWNKDGNFEDSSLERIYNGTVGVSSTTFGFEIPPNTAPGDYRIRMRVNNFASFGNANNFNSCEYLNRAGETEDYLFTVLESCTSQIVKVTGAERCGAGDVTISAEGTAATKKLRWYLTETGGAFNFETNANASGAGSLLVSNVLQTTIYYVSAVNSTNCESKVRKPVTIKIKPLPEISFTINSPTGDFCGDTNKVILSTNATEEEVELLYENFEGGTLGKFSVTNPNPNNTTPSVTQWQNKKSVFNPTLGAWRPAISSGYNDDRFAFATSDDGAGTNVSTVLTSNTTINTTNFTELYLDFSYYFSFYGRTNEAFTVEISANGVGNTVLATYKANQSIGTKFSLESLAIPSAYLNKNNVEIIFKYNSGGWSDGIAIDNVRLYGTRPLVPSFNFIAPDVVLYNDDGNCNKPYDGTTTSICIKPAIGKIETVGTFNISATINLTNGCSATGSTTIENNNKFWDNTSTPTITNWGNGTPWSPNGIQPTITKCVTIKSPVTISTADAFAKNITILPGGKISITGKSLTVNDIINNTTGDPRNLIVYSDGNLKQIDDSVVNTTPISARRKHNFRSASRLEYNYISSPVKNQDMKMIFGDNPNFVPYVTVLDEPSSYFVNAKPSDYVVKGKGFSVKEPTIGYVGVPAEGITPNEAEYKGVPNNGFVTLDLAWSASNRGYNLAGNPYPSDVDIIDLYTNSRKIVGGTADISADFRFWDNTINNIYQQMGGGYQGYSYAVFNATTGINGNGTAAPGRTLNPPNTTAGSKVPTRVIKVSQAFMVRALKPGAELKFNNSMRKTASTGVVFYGKESADNYYRLEFTTPDSLVIQNVISYFDGGNVGLGIEDSKIPNSSASDALFTLVEGAKIIINGRPLFTNQDVIHLGTRNFKVGTYFIRAIDQSGIFANGQAIYLKDKDLGILTDISSEAYSFTSLSGEFTNRFEIVYVPEVVLVTDSSAKFNIQLYRDQLDFVVQSSVKKIVHIELYDMSGRLMFNQKANAKTARFNAEALVDGAYVLKTQLEGGEIFTQKLRK